GFSTYFRSLFQATRQLVVGSTFVSKASALQPPRQKGGASLRPRLLVPITPLHSTFEHCDAT
ncbi:MAG TPA: hypothetical protein VN939_07810, partial [Chthoniobacterales bacterium]|nr:hypothetical protein [Chthoniobacterales bacterium]